MNNESQGVVVVYDGQCPFCSRYVMMLRLREAFGQVALVDARSDDPRALEARQLFDLDAGMAARLGGRWYHGADCMNVLSLATGPSTLVNRLIAALFSDPKRAKVLYPFFKAGRNTALALLGRHKIKDDAGQMHTNARLLDEPDADAKQ